MQELTFGPFSLDLAAGRLLRDAIEVKLRPQAFRALSVLVANRGVPVDHGRLLAEAWQGIAVSPHTVDVTLAEVRKALQEYGSWIRRRGRAGYCLDVPESDLLVRRGWHFWKLRSREGFDRSLECFREAAAVSPDDFRAYQGQAACYILLAAYGMEPGRALREKFFDAHQRAEALAGLTPELRCTRAQALHMFDWRLDEAEAELRHALAQRPTLALASVGLAYLQVTLGRLDEALACAARASALDPLLPMVSATELAIRFWRREYDAAVALGARAVELHPYFLLGRSFHAHALEYSGRLAEALEQYHVGLVMSRDLPWVRAYQGICLVKLQRRREARQVLRELEALRSRVYVDAYAMALFRYALGQTAGAFAEMDRAIEERCASVFCIEVDPRADALRADPRYARVRRRLRAAGRRRQAS